MNIQQFAKKPELMKIEITEPSLVEAYEGPVIFWIYDSIDITTYFDFFKSQADGDGEKLNELVRKLIRNEHGEICIDEGHILPVDLAIASLTAINERLGKSRTKPSTQSNGTQPA
jgi:hypothetical protein